MRPQVFFIFKIEKQNRRWSPFLSWLSLIFHVIQLILTENRWFSYVTSTFHLFPKLEILGYSRRNLGLHSLSKLSSKAWFWDSQKTNGFCYVMTRVGFQIEFLGDQTWDLLIRDFHPWDFRKIRFGIFIIWTSQVCPTKSHIWRQDLQFQENVS